MFESIVPPPVPPVVLQWWQKPEWLAFLATVFGVLVALATLWCVVRQLKLEGRQTDLAEQTKALAQEQAGLAREQTRLGHRQTELIENQDKILARLANLVVVAKSNATPDGMAHIDFVAENQGDGGVSNFYWYLFVPRELTDRTAYSVRQWTGSSGIGNTIVWLDGREYHRYSSFCERPVYPSHQIQICQMGLAGGRAGHLQSYVIRWQLIALSGIYPGGEEPGNVEVTV